MPGQITNDTTYFNGLVLRRVTDAMAVGGGSAGHGNNRPSDGAVGKDAAGGGSMMGAVDVGG